MACPAHPAIALPPLFACPLCVQAARRATYAVQLSQSLEIRRQREGGQFVPPSPCLSAGEVPGTSESQP
jgi:hypothetical protein